MLLMNGVLRRALIGETQTSSAIAIGAAVFSAHSIVVWVMWPRLATRSKKPLPLERVVVSRWIFASMPYWVGFVAVIAGGRRWCYGVGLVVSIVLLVLTARWVRRLAM
jgi:hypothetical protein